MICTRIKNVSSLIFMLRCRSFIHFQLQQFKSGSIQLNASSGGGGGGDCSTTTNCKENGDGSEKVCCMMFAENRNIFYLNQIGVLQTVNGDASQEDYSAKTHELQTIIEKQVSFDQIPQVFAKF